MSFTTNTPSFEFGIGPITQTLFPYIQRLANIIYSFAKRLIY